jgi:hypothetical protein
MRIIEILSGTSFNEDDVVSQAPINNAMDQMAGSRMTPSQMGQMARSYGPAPPRTNSSPPGYEPPINNAMDQMAGSRMTPSQMGQMARSYGPAPPRTNSSPPGYEPPRPDVMTGMVRTGSPSAPPAPARPQGSGLRPDASVPYAPNLRSGAIGGRPGADVPYAESRSPRRRNSLIG